MFQDNFLWRILGQNEGNEIYSLSAGYSGTGKWGWFRNRRSYHWLCEIGG